MIGDGIVITVVEIRGDKVRLGIEAPRDVSVHRKEVYQALAKRVRSSRRESAVVGFRVKVTQDLEAQPFELHSRAWI